jgi:hypothetical protein
MAETPRRLPWGLPRARRVTAAILAICALVVAVAILWREGDEKNQDVDWGDAADALPARASGAPVAVFPARQARRASTHLGRRPTSGPVTSDRVWLLVAPRRERGHLVPVRPRAIGPPDFARRSARTHHGFQVIELRVPARAAFVPEAFGSPPPALLVR